MQFSSPARGSSSRRCLVKHESLIIIVNSFGKTLGQFDRRRLSAFRRQLEDPGFILRCGSAYGRLRVSFFGGNLFFGPIGKNERRFSVRKSVTSLTGR